MRTHPLARILAPSLALAVALTACGGDDDNDATTSRGAASSSGAPATTAVDDASSTSVATGASPSTGAATATSVTEPGIDLEDGRHPVYVTGIDVAGRTLTFDVIQFLTGAEAVAAYHADNPTDPEGPPNDYYIVNENPKLRTASVAADASVMLVRLAEDSNADLDPGTFEELAAYLAATGPGEGAALSGAPYWITVDAGVITGIEEQYVP